MNRLQYLLFFYFVFTLGATAQTSYNHNLFWARIVFADTITKSIKWEVHLQKRTQDTNEGSNAFSAPQFSAIWLWLNFKLSDNLTLGVTPFSYFDSYVLYTKPSDLEVSGIKEYRWVGRLDNEQKFKFLNYITRFSQEYRLRDLQNNDNYQGNFRTRFMFRFEKPVTFGTMARPVTLNFI